VETIKLFVLFINFVLFSTSRAYKKSMFNSIGGAEVESTDDET